MKTIFLTGGSGLLAVNWAISRRKENNIFLGLHDRVINLENTKTIFVNLKSIENLISIFEHVKPDLIVNTAGLTSVEKCESDLKLAKEVNVITAKNVAQASLIKKIKFVHISTDHLFSGKNKFVSETLPTECLNVYAETKAEAEIAVADINPYSLIVRTNFYGWGTSYRASFSDFIIKSLESGKEITLFDDVFYTPIVCDVLVRTVHELVEKGISGIFNIVGDERISKYHFGLKVAEFFNLDASLIKRGKLSYMDSLVIRPFDMSLSNNKVKRILNTSIGGVDEHLVILKNQEKEGVRSELGCL